MRHFLLNNTSFVPTKGVVLSKCAASITDSVWLKSFKTVLLTVITIAAFLGNLFIVYIVYKKKKMRRTTNIFIANMAASDIFIATVLIPKILVELFIRPSIWIIDGLLGSILCKFCYVLTDASVCISIISHAVIAIDRFWPIVYSLRPSPITPSRRKYIIYFTWLYSFVLHSPNLYIYRLRQKDGINYCVIDWSPLDSKTSKKTYFTVIFIFVFCIPVFIITVLYSWLIISMKTKKSLCTLTSQVRKQRRKEDIRVFRKVVVMVIVFLISSIPMAVLGLLSYFIWDGELPCKAWAYAFVAYLLFFSNCAINPFLCIVLYKSYRYYLRKLFCARRRNLTIISRSPNANILQQRPQEITDNGEGTYSKLNSKDNNGKDYHDGLDSHSL